MSGQGRRRWVREEGGVWAEREEANPPWRGKEGGTLRG